MCKAVNHVNRSEHSPSQCKLPPDSHKTYSQLHLSNEQQKSTSTIQKKKEGTSSKPNLIRTLVTHAICFGKLNRATMQETRWSYQAPLRNSALDILPFHDFKHRSVTGQHIYSLIH